MVCLDTTFLADIQRRSPQALRKMDEMERRGEFYSTTVVTAAELFRGAHRRSPVQMTNVEELLRDLVVWEMNMIAARQYGVLSDALRKQGLEVGALDLLIASIALAHGETRIVTRNVKDFERIPGIEVVGY